MKKVVLVLLFAFACCLLKPVVANEGMWLPQLLASLNEKEMKAMGMKISAKDIYDINKSSLKDAIVSLGGFCTAEVISGEGLLLTNHHCAFDAIQKHTTLQNNYIDKGFWAMSRKDELPNPGLTATFIIRIEEITRQALQHVADGMEERERQSQVDKNLNAVRATVQKEDWQDVLIRPFFEGNRYFLFITETYTDIRLAGAPPSSIGKFGSDTDNWMWPRHTGDFAMFRIYADKNNRPAAYSVNNVPYKPKRFLNISLDGLEKNDFTMVFGFPGRTQEYLHSAAIAQVLNRQNPAKIAIRTKALDITDKYMRQDPGIKIQYASKYASTANAWKKWIGESQGLQATNAVAKRQLYEADFQKRVNATDSLGKYRTLLEELSATYAFFDGPALYRDIFNETVRNVEMLSFASRVIPLINASAKGETSYNNYRDDLKEYSIGFFKNFQPGIDKEVAVALLDLYKEKMPASFIPAALQTGGNTTDLVQRIFSTSSLVSATAFNNVLNKPMDEAVNMLRSDPLVQLASEMGKLYAKNNLPGINDWQVKINRLQQVYMQAQMDVFREKKFYPDANSTLRVTYGKVNGYSAKDAVLYDHYTYLDGVMEKYVPGDYEFDVPAKLIELHAKKDYGRYGINGKMPVCFIASNHTTGGNSGSPALDAYGNLVGLNFDRVWEGTMSDINYDTSICRNIMVDVRYILFITDKFAGAGHLLNEMKLVNPKKIKK
ncbi:MAG: S46 family peptidase [Chitinophagaceae bacterium]|nr:S46 family peptidase [Chitinophagaceae bacterium]